MLRKKIYNGPSGVKAIQAIRKAHVFSLRVNNKLWDPGRRPAACLTRLGVRRSASRLSVSLAGAMLAEVVAI